MSLPQLLAISIIIIGLSNGQNVKFLVVTESAQQELNSKFAEGLKSVQDVNPGTQFDMSKINFTRKFADDAYSDMCSLLQSSPYTAVIDMAWGGWIKGRKIGAEMGIPYIRVESANHPFVRAADDYLKSRNSVDAALVFPRKIELDQSLYYIIGNSYLRIIGAQMQDPEALGRLQRMRPRPSNYLTWGTASELKSIYEKAKTSNLVKRDSRWTLIFSDFNEASFSRGSLIDTANVITMTNESCCAILNRPLGSSCQCSTPMAENIVKISAAFLAETALKLAKDGKTFSKFWSCGSIGSSSNQTRTDFESYLATRVNASRYVLQKDKHGIPLILPFLEMNVRLQNKSDTIQVGSWDPKAKFTPAVGYQMQKIKRFFRVGVVLGLPWAFINGSEFPIDPKYMDSSKPNKGLTGYCIDLLEKLALHLDFEYEIVPSSKNAYGHKLPNGSWTGIVGDLISGEIDISVATLTMTTEREEVIDFVAPYFDQSGISILLRKAVPDQSIFKFMSVLKQEVWFGILGAVVAVSFLLWALDRFSPYSYYNNKDAYPEGARDFTFGESIWFALTSLTPQGGGECPKALSGRVLVAAYWLFIVLMLATFTANLAAFLTVERMQTTVQSLEELARQSRINFSVVANSPYMEYFKNMAGAEEELYRKWKEITLNSSSDQSKYRVWDYPVREQYAHILKVIESSGPLSSPEEGFKRVEAAVHGDFAFIHDASEVRYHYYKNCNFIEVGEPFAEQPLAVAVQQGSHLQKEISKAILALQKERYFEQLTVRYWDSKERNDCPVLDDSKGITLSSLGGIFLATLVGLLLSMITLAYEVWQQRRAEKNQVHISGTNDPGKTVQVGDKQIKLTASFSQELIGEYSSNTKGMPAVYEPY